MKVKRFLGAFFVVLGFLVVLGSVQSCGSRDEIPRVNFYLDLTQPQYAVLGNTGGYVLINNVIVAHGVNGYIALSGYCTYDNAPLAYYASTDDFACPACMSRFYSTGKVEFGPASIPLVQYATTLSGTQLQVYTP